MMKRKKITTVLIGITGSSLLALTPPAQAFVAAIGFATPLLIDFAKNELFSEAVDQVTGYIGMGEEAWGYIEQVIESDGSSLLSDIMGVAVDQCDSAMPVEMCDAITSDGKSIARLMEGTVGDMGLPVPDDYRVVIAEEVEESLNDPTWAYVGNPTSILGSATNAGDRGLTRIQTSSVLGTEGQKAMTERIEQNKDMAKTTVELANNGLANFSETGLLQTIAMMEAQQTILSQKEANNSELSRVDNQIANLNLANISETLDNDQKEEAVDKNITYEGLVNAATFVMY